MFKELLLGLVTQGLADLAQAQENGKVPKNSLSESHFFSVWIGQAIKSKRFDVCLFPLLKRWQQEARTSGAGADLKTTFAQLKSTYSGVVGQPAATKETLAQLVLLLDAQQWQVTTDTMLGKKTSIKSQGNSSLVIAPTEFDNGFNKSSQISCYVRGDQQQFIDACYSLGLLVFKKTEYKSIVKFHSHMTLDADNNDQALPAYPSI